ncbi:MAG TPA: polysaccharide biosynthesis tyrosine autokinase [Methylomirabilota bacterium]|nr:polysaccharide biosynthesis tyrosine autokinase [Methylomirabilota bacterium]
MPDDSTTSADVDYLRLLRRIAGRWRLVAAVFLAVALPIAAWGLIFIPKTYEAVAKIFLEDPRRQQAGLMRDWMPTSDAAFQLAILKSRSLAEAVVENLPRETTEEMLARGMHRDYLLEARNLLRRVMGQDAIVYSPQQRAVTELQSARVTFNPLPSGEVEIRAVAYNPRVAMDLANTYVEVLQTRSRSNIRDDARASREFIENLLNQTKASLQTSEDKLSKAARGRSPRLPDRSGVEAAQVSQLENSLAEIQGSKEVAKVRLATLRGKDPSGKQLVRRLAQLQEKLAGLQERYTDGHPLVKSTQAEIKDTQAMLAAGPQAAPERVAAGPFGAAERAAGAKQIADLEQEIVALETREDVVKQRLARVSQSLSSLGAEEMEVAKLRQSVDAQRNLLTSLSEKLGTARIQEQGEDRGLRLIDLASMPQRPSSVPAMKVVLLGMMAGLGLGLGLAGVLEYVRQPMETEEDISAATGLPVLGWLPTIQNTRPDRGPEREPLSFIDVFAPNTLPIEACRSIRVSLLSLPREQEVRTIMLASAGPGEGKSTVVLNLSYVFAQAGRRLVMIDGDLRRPSLNRPLRRPVAPGVAEVLEAKVSLEEALQPIKERFHLLPAGATDGSDPGMLLGADNVRRLLELVKGQADTVVFDSAPVLAVADNLALASMVDAVILVVRAGVTQRRDLVRAKALLDKVGAPVVGAVLNRVSPRETRRYYRSYSGYYGIGEGGSARRRLRSATSWWPVRQRSNVG